MERRVRTPWDTSGYAAVVRRILGPTYALSVALVGDHTARRLNRERRGKDTPANVLTFPLDERHGEIILNLARIRREAGAFGLSPEGHATFLLIHGCLHLKGCRHGVTMEQAEDAYVRAFNVR